MNINSMKQLIFSAFILFGFIQTGICQTTSEWRGIGRTGVYNETGLLKKWPDNGPQLLWSATGLPKGNSSVAFGNNLLYLTGTKDTMEVLMAFDMKGTKIWETTFGRAWSASFPESRCTPTVNDNRVYVTSGKLDAACIDGTSGKIIWAVKVNEKFNGAYGMWGKAESPIVLDDKVFFTPSGNKTTMVALNKLTGETIWASESLKDGSSYVSPLLIERNGKQQIVNLTEKFVFGISPKDGKILWKFDYGQYAAAPDHYNILINTPIYWNGGIFITNGYNHSSAMLDLSEDGNSVTQRWIENVMDTHLGGDVRLGSYIYGSNWQNNAKGKWVCLDWNTGKTLYETDWITKGQIISADGMLYCYEEKTGNIALVKASPEKFEVISSFKVPLGRGVHWSHPVINKGILYVRHMDALMAYNIRE
jgi:outer membrane protein assembly factor BamB